MYWHRNILSAALFEDEEGRQIEDFPSKMQRDDGRSNFVLNLNLKVIQRARPKLPLTLY
jgi:hypothetical protein